MFPIFLLATEPTTTAVTVTSLNGVFWALGGTIVAALVAAISSCYASHEAAVTAQKVVSLQNETAEKLKNIDYTNDFYKKIIAK